MPVNNITDPRGTYGNSPKYGQVADFVKTSAAVPAKTVVAIGGTAPNFTVATAATDSTASLSYGIVDVAAASGDTARVITSGIVTGVPVDGATAVGAILKRSVTTAGRLAATASPAAGEPIAISLAASASNTTTVLVLKSI